MRKITGLLVIAAVGLFIYGCGTSNPTPTDTVDNDTAVADTVGDLPVADTIADATDIAQDIPPVVPTSFRLGYAETDITPPVGTVLGGYGVPAMNRVTTGTHDPLMGQAALFVNNAGQAFLIISVDLAGYMWDFGDWGPGIKVLRQSIVDALAPTVTMQPEHIVIASSHSHGATDLMGFSQAVGEGPNKELLASHIQKLTDVAVAAAANLKDANLYFGATELVGLTSRDKDCSPVLDNSVAIMQARDLEGKVLVTIANYSKHPTVAAEANKLASADFIWGYREEMRLATEAPAMFLQGFEAAVHGRYSFYDEPDMWDKVYEIGHDLAAAVIAVQDALTPADQFDIQHRAAVYSCTGKDSFMASAVINLNMPKRNITINEDESVTVNEIEISWHKLGPAEFAIFPGEPSPEYAMMSKERMTSPFKFAVALGNDATGYIVEPESLANDTSGQLSGYELMMGLGAAAGPNAWTAMESLGWFNGGWNVQP